MLYNWLMDMAFTSGYRPKEEDIINVKYPYIVFLRCKSTSLETTQQYFGWDRE